MQTYGIDTSILVRLLTGEPQADYQQTLAALEALLDREPNARLVASNMVIAEAYIVTQHFYGVSKHDARHALLQVLRSGLVEPQAGKTALEQITAASRGAGLADRLIVNDYHKTSCITLTNDKRMAKLTGAQLL